MEPSPRKDLTVPSGALPSDLNPSFRADTFARVQAKTLLELVGEVLGEIDPRRRQRARERMASKVFELAQAVARKMLPSEADDVAQEVILSVVLSTEDPLLSGEVENPDAYVRRAARNEAISLLRKQAHREEKARQAAAEEAPTDPGALQEEETVARQDLAALREVLSSSALNPRYRYLLEQIFRHQRSIEDLVDEEMQRPENAGKSRATVRNSSVDQPLSRARKRVAALLAQHARERSN
jgi:RNA polymerase sigma factor (sigma-70 family)